MRYAILTTALIALLILVAGTGCYKELKVTVAINQDGTVVATTDMLSPREDAEQQLARFESSQADEDEGEGETDAVETPPNAQGDNGPGDDAQFAAQVRKAIEKQMAANESEQGEADSRTTDKLETVEVHGDTVRIVTSRRYADLGGFVAAFEGTLRWFQHDSILIDTDENGRLRITMTPSSTEEAGVTEWLESMRDDLEDSEFKGVVTFVLPGDVISSTLPHTDKNKTYIEVDATSDESLKGMEEFYREKQVIVAEPGKLDLSKLPLRSESKEPQGENGAEGSEAVENAEGGEEGNVAASGEETAEGEGAADGGGAEKAEEIPVAGEGFAVEALGVTTTIVHVFPEAREKFKDYVNSFEMGGTSGCVIQARLYAPEGRTISGLGAVRVTRAVDDQGRPIKPKRGQSDGDALVAPIGFIRSGSDEPGTQTDFAMRLELPPRDAITIEELEGEAIVTTFGNWKEHRIDKIQADKEKEIDVSDVLPGAAVAIRSVKARVDEDGNLSGTVSLKATGPEELQHVEFRVEAPDVENLRSNETRTSSTSRAGKRTRTITIQVYAYGEELEPDQEVALTLVVRQPDDIKRERVKFTLEAVDLF